LPVTVMVALSGSSPLVRETVMRGPAAAVGFVGAVVGRTRGAFVLGAEGAAFGVVDEPELALRGDAPGEVT